MKRKICLSLAACMLFGASAQAVESTYLHPKVKSKEISVRRVAVLPAMVSLSKQGVKGREEMGEQEDKAAGAIQASVAAALIQSGITAEMPFGDDALKDNSELKYAVADVQQRFDDIAPKLYKKPKDVRKGRFSLGDQVAVLNSRGTEDALVIIRSEGLKETKGRSFMTGGLVGMALSKNAMFRTHVAVVDAKTGDILFLGEYISSGVPKAKLFKRSFRGIRVE